MCDHVLESYQSKFAVNCKHCDLYLEEEELLAVVSAGIKASEQMRATDGLHSCLCGDRIPLDEYRCSNCRTLETAHLLQFAGW